MCRRLALLIVVAAAVLCAAAAPGGAHEGDPGVVTVLDSITPALPAGVTVQVVSSIAAQLLAENTTSTPLQAVADTGEVFLRVSAAGVEANFGSRAWYESNAPQGRARVPATLGPPRFATVQMEPSWGWFDHRLHPSEVVVPPAVRAAKVRSRLADWTVPLQYGATEITLRGHLEYRPVLGRIVTALASRDVPDGVVMATVDGRLPGVFLRNDTGGEVRVLGPDGELFALIRPDWVGVNRRSRVHLEDSRAKGGEVTAAPSGEGLTVVSNAPTYSWLDLRLRYSEPVVPAEVQRRRRPTVLVRWTIPLEIAGVRTDVTGTTSFVPFDVAADGEAGGNLSSRLTAGLAGLAGVLVLVAVAVGRRRRI
ncbi:MAG TPA: hypothetical protein VNB94_07930 [Mycobacteriales bacterium]|nr:hypothetical protein [Mycobacteriales bacterium]